MLIERMRSIAYANTLVKHYLAHPMPRIVWFLLYQGGPQTRPGILSYAEHAVKCFVLNMTGGAPCPPWYYNTSEQASQIKSLNHSEFYDKDS